jgi:transposase
MPEEIVGRILRLRGYRAYRWEFDEAGGSLTIWVRQEESDPFYICGGCGLGSRSIHSVWERRVRDLPWGTWKVWLWLEVHRVHCRRCGVRTERIEFLEGKQPYTWRFAEAVARDCEDAAVRRVAAKWSLSVQTVLRIDKRALSTWSNSRPRRALRHMGVDEIFWGKGKCLTVVSNLETGEPLWAGPERKRETLDRFFTEYLPPRRRRWVRAVCVDMWEGAGSGDLRHRREGRFPADRRRRQDPERAGRARRTRRDPVRQRGVGGDLLGLCCRGGERQLTAGRSQRWIPRISNRAASTR